MKTKFLFKPFGLSSGSSQVIEGVTLPKNFTGELGFSKPDSDENDDVVSSPKSYPILRIGFGFWLGFDGLLSLIGFVLKEVVAFSCVNRDACVRTKGQYV